MPNIKRCTVSYIVADDETDEKRHLTCETLDSGRYVCSDPNAAITIAFDGEVFDIELQAFRDIRISACSVDASHRFLRTERVLLNGYQSWTDTVESDINAFRHGLRGLPRNLIEHFLLDTAGDYRFAEYGFTPGLMHGWTYAAMRRGGSCCLIASLNEDNGFTLIRFNTHENLIQLEKEVPQHVVSAGERLHLCTMALIFRSAAQFQPGDKPVVGVPAAEEDAFDRWFELMGIRRLPAKPLVGYSSWYRHFDSVDHKKVEADLEAAANVMAHVDTRGFERVFQIDDGYAKVGDWLETYEG